MTDQDETAKSPVETEVEKPVKPHRARRGLWGVLVLILIAAGGGGYAALTLPLFQKPPTSMIVQAPVQDGDLSRRVRRLEDRVAELEHRPVATEPRAESQDEVPPPSTALRSEVQELQESVKKVQVEALRAADQAAQSKSRSDSGVASVVAFIQLRSAATAGRGFAPELRVFRQALGSEESLQEELAALDPLAAHGAMTLPALRELYLTSLTEAEAALRKSTATTWQERLRAVLQGLVTVRDKHDTTSPEGLLAALGEDLAAGRLGAALEKQGQLPDAAQAALQQWRDQAMARFNLDSALDRLAGGLIGKTKG